MRPILFVLLALPLGAQDLALPCEASQKTLRLLEAVPSLREMSIPFENRIGALRALAERNSEDFFIQRAYQDSFRHSYHLSDEFDWALAMYRKRASDPRSRYYEARLLMYAQPQRSREAFEELLKAEPEFVWPHLDFVEWGSMPGLRRGNDSAPHLKAFRDACPEALPTGVQAMVLDNAPSVRAALEQRNSRIDLNLWPQLWSAEERAGIGADILQIHVRGDLKRIQGWRFHPDRDLLYVYREASRILKDQSLMEELRAKVEQEAPDSLLAFSFVENRWYENNPRPKQVADSDDQKAYQEYPRKEAAAQREWLRSWPNAASPVRSLWLNLQTRAQMGEADVSAEDLAVVDRFVRLHELSPDGGVQFPPLETALARVYVAGKVRLDQVPKLLELGLKNVEKQMKYSPSPDLFPEEMRNRATDWREVTWQQTDQIRADYLQATNRPREARSLVEQALTKLDAKHNMTPQERNRVQFDRIEWVRRLANINAQEGRVEEALAAYQISLAGFRKESLSQPAMQSRLAPIRRYYLAHGGTEEKWPEWATEKTNAAEFSLQRTAPTFLKPLPQFSAKDLSGRTWQLGQLNGKATLVNLWATWCGPCRGEHADIQKLYETIKDRKDLQVLTVSVDESPGAVTAYVKEKGYTFPVIYSPELADKLFPYVGLPTNFLVNARGVRTSLYGFMTGASGLRRVLEDLEKAAKAQE